MSNRSKFPRVSAATRPPAPRAVRLPKLCCSIYRDGVLVGIQEQPDPRIGFCESFAEQGGKFGYSAKPISNARQLRAARKAQAAADRREAARKAVAQ
jgi:hypothetical protein